jgi:hypothetical protein
MASNSNQDRRVGWKFDYHKFVGLEGYRVGGQIAHNNCTWDDAVHSTSKKNRKTHIIGKKVPECLYRRYQRIMTGCNKVGELPLHIMDSAPDDDDDDMDLDLDNVPVSEGDHGFVANTQSTYYATAQNSSASIVQAQDIHNLAATNGHYDRAAWSQAEEEQQKFESYVQKVHPSTVEGVFISSMHNHLSCIESGSELQESIKKCIVHVPKVHVGNIRAFNIGIEVAIGADVKAYPRAELLSDREQSSDFTVDGIITSDPNPTDNTVGVNFHLCLLSPRQSIVLAYMHERIGINDESIQPKRFPSARKALWALRNVTVKAGLQICLPTNALNELMRKVKEDHRAKPASSFDMVDHGWLLHESSLTAWSRPLDSVMYWTMFLIMMACILRASEVTTFCPNIESIQLPEKDEDTDSVSGLPNWMEFSLYKTKTRKGAAATQPYTMRIHRNKCFDEFCPVYHLCYYMTAANLWDEKGPIFRKIYGLNGFEYVTYGLTLQEDGAWIDPHMKTDQRIQVDSWRSALKLLFLNVMNAHIRTCSSHSVRRSAVKWASRCKAQMWQILNAGRWMEYTLSFMLYIQSGARDAERYVDDPASDPIFTIWTWLPVTQDTAINAELSGALHQSRRQAR